ncbi:Inner membrane protein YhaI [Aquimixticola soesokkakensis]|uniref:Inner membrane protein YhaI n=1 Tax=Aquimixticola soesokkakensis TaxID=1519096 RepID=A0A1Y5RMS4_9RHOB|nr:DUF805 domain-containing protein [Aquimixticola soesokkakensis]SLN21119.1 Inner membrane protein YhaI [Aquimixticola soesokkakensis]
MDFKTATKTCLQKYATFSGRAPRSEYWYFILFSVLGQFLLSLVDMLLGMGDLSPLSSLFSLALVIPTFAAGARRLHDINRTGWWQLLTLIPIIGWIVLLVWYVKKGDDSTNRFGSDPLSNAPVADDIALDTSAIPSVRRDEV